MAGCQEMINSMSTAFENPRVNSLFESMLVALQASHPGVPMDQLIGVIVKNAIKPMIDDLIKELPDKIIHNLRIKSKVFPFSERADTSIPRHIREARVRELFLTYNLNVILSEADLEKYQTSEEAINITLTFLKNFLLSSIHGKILDHLR